MGYHCGDIHPFFDAVIDEQGEIGKGFHLLMHHIHNLCSGNHLIHPILHLPIIRLQHLVKGCEIRKASGLRPQALPKATAVVPACAMIPAA